jgi:uncharacterized repeat protein (TIGR03803 family)
MKNRALGIFFSAGILAGCMSNASQPPLLPPGAASKGSPFGSKAPAPEKVLYRFKGGTDGAEPEPKLIAVGNTLYGTTLAGGDPSCGTSSAPGGCGTLFQIDASGGGYAVLYRFGKSAQSGNFPATGVIDVDSTLVGTAFSGGGDGSQCSPSDDGCGTLYEIDSTGKGFKVLHDFGAGDDGIFPFSNPVNGKNGTLYGTTIDGGSGCDASGACGTVYAFDLTTKTESIVYSFKGGTDGREPRNLTDANGVLYGATFEGGSDSACASYTYYTGCGTIFRVDPASGKEKVLYRFKGGKDGAFPLNLLSVNGDLYGSTFAGGPGCAGGSGFTGCGTVFRVNATSGAETVLYRFKGGSDGYRPNPLWADLHGTLYATTNYGGGTGCGGSGCGTIFKIDTSGKGYAVIYSFLGGTDGANPSQGVTAANGKLYGTTHFGGGTGCGGSGCGTVFEATP